MEIHVQTIVGINTAQIRDPDFLLEDVTSAVELLMNCSYQGADVLLLQKEQLHPDFFELKSGLAGDILQKFSTYQFKLGIIGDFSVYTSQALRDFIFESNKQGRIVFAENEEVVLRLFR